MSVGRGGAGDLQCLELEIDGDDGDVLLAFRGAAKQVATVIAVTGSEIDEEQAAGFIGEFVEDRLDRFRAAKSAINAPEMLEVQPQRLGIQIG